MARTSYAETRREGSPTFRTNYLPHQTEHPCFMKAAVPALRHPLGPRGRSLPDPLDQAHRILDLAPPQRMNAGSHVVHCQSQSYQGPSGCGTDYMLPSRLLDLHSMWYTVDKLVRFPRFWGTCGYVLCSKTRPFQSQSSLGRHLCGGL